MTLAQSSELIDAEARRSIREDIGDTLFVEAAAGTGKTTALVSRIVAVLSGGKSTLDRIAAVTYTEKAAGEMKLRLRAEIENLRVAPETTDLQRTRLELAIEHLELARIGTIHAFCADLLHERPVEACVDPLFEMAPTEDAEALLDLVFDHWFERILAKPPEGIRRILRQTRESRTSGPRASLRAAASALVLHRNFPAGWSRRPFSRDAAIDALLTQLREVGARARLAKKPDDWLAKNLFAIEQFVEDVDLRERVRARDHDGLEAELRKLARRQTGWHYRGSQYLGFHGNVARDQVLAERDAAKSALDRFLEESGADLAAHLREDLRPVVQAYELAKQREGRLDFLDLLIRARNLVRDHRAVREELRERFTHFFVDEFQDTDPLQAEILLLLSADDPDESNWLRAKPVQGKLFFVGDPKQSIYRFRGADIAQYEAIKGRLREHGARVIQLSTSFRSLPNIQLAVNAAFSRGMTAREDGGQAAYVPLSSFRKPNPKQPSLVALPVPRPFAKYGKVTDYAIEQSLPDAIAAFVDWLVNQSGWTVRNEVGDEVDIGPRHICILFRRLQSSRRDETRAYVHALEARRIPHVIVGGSSFHAREEVMAVRNALTAIEWPDDNLSVFATLRGPLFALSDDQILAFKGRVGSLHPLHSSKSDDLDEPEREVANALAILRDHHVRRNSRPIAETVYGFLQTVRAQAGIAIWPTGEQALANCLRVVERARRFERRGAASFRAFVELMEDEAELHKASEAPVVEEGSEGVRIMSVHKAKGLEFPVVVLADLTCNATREDPSQFVDYARGLWAEQLCRVVPSDLLDNRETELERDREEAVRIAYVAATRAKDLLVVPVVGDEAQRAWLEVLNPALYPKRSSWTQPRMAHACPAFGKDSVTERPEKAAEGTGVAPGLHVAEGENEVVWWDPNVLVLDVETSVGLRQDELLRADESGEVAAEGIEAHGQWHARRQRSLEDGALSSLRVETVTEMAATQAQPLATSIDVVYVDTEREGRPRGARFGALVHSVLACISLDADRDQIRVEAAAQSSMFGAPVQEVEAAAATVECALRHPVLRRAATAQPLRREEPVMLSLEDDRIVEGVLDLAFREEINTRQVWTVVDFKTDHELGSKRNVYERQLSLYVRAVEAATGEPAHGVLLVL